MKFVYMLLTLFCLAACVPQQQTPLVSSDSISILQDIASVELYNADRYIHDNYTYSLFKEKNMFDSVVKLTLAMPLPSFMQLNPNTIAIMPVGSATGFSIYYDKKTDTSYVLTNDHFCKEQIETGAILVAQTTNGMNKNLNPGMVDAVVIKTDPSYDLCVVSVAGFIRPVVMESEKKTADAFEKVTVVGAPYGVFPIILETFVSGYVSREDGALGDMFHAGGNSFLMLSGEIMPGHSGSPVFNSHGKVIGIIFCGQMNAGVFPVYGALAVTNLDIKEFLESVKIQ